MSLDSSFSFDLYPGLDAELQAAYERNVGTAAGAEALGATGLRAAIDESLGDRAARFGPLGEAQLSPNFREIIEKRHEAIMRLFEGKRLQPFEHIALDDPEFAQVNWGKLEAAYDAMNAAGWTPQFVLAPQNFGPDEWQALYKELPNTQNGGLYINDEVLEAWDEQEIVGLKQPAKWSWSVVPTTPEPLIKNTAHNIPMQDLEAFIPDPAIRQALDLDSLESAADSYPDLNTYLTIQALLLEHNLDPLDSETYTWLNGTFQNGQRAPYACLNPGRAQVSVSWYKVGGRDDHLGVRPAVRGVEL